VPQVIADKLFATSLVIVRHETVQLRAAGIAVQIDEQQYPNGRFARLHDPEGNPIELWEPAGRDTPG
jgi:hypothetical protein